MSASGLEGYAPEEDAVAADIAALAAQRRGSVGPGEREAAAWVRDRLAAVGGQDARLEPYRGRATYGWSFAAHAAAGLPAALRGGPGARAAALAALWSLERDASGRPPWRRRVAGGAPGANAVARVPARAERRLTVVLVAHLDAAHTGLVWHPALTRAGGRSHLRRHAVDPFLAPVGAALAVSALAPGRRPRALAAAVLGLTAALNAEVAGGATVPGANDNATGVAVVIDLMRALAATPLEHVEVVGVCPGGEEAGMGGFAAWLREHRGEVRPASTLVLGLDTLGSGTPIVAEAEGALQTHRYRPADLGLADEGAALAGLPAPQRWRIGGWTDPLLALHAGIPAISMLSMGPGYFPHYHHPTDVPAHVDRSSVERCARIAAGTLRAAVRARAGGGP